MSARCRDGHDSTELDYCSVCGVAMKLSAAKKGGPGALPVHAVVASAERVCPSCGEPRADMEARYCEVCRYDFVTKKPGPPPTHAGPVPSPPPANVVVSASTTAAASVRWELAITVDPALDVDPDPASPCPKDASLAIVVLDRDILVGRRDDRRDIVPELPVNDPGASRRHAKFVRGADGMPALQDLASTNGTKLNNADVVPGSRVALKAGDEVTLGRWTRIKVRVRP